MANIIDNIIAGAERVAERLRLGQLDEQITEAYPDDHPLAGQPARVRTLKRTAQGFEYVTDAAARDLPARHAPLAERVVRHSFANLDSLASFLGHHAQAAAFLDGAWFHPMKLEALLDPDEPQRGAVTALLGRHPAFLRWAQAFGVGAARDITLTDLADHCRDNVEDFEDELTARLLSTLHVGGESAESVDAESGSSSSVRWKVKGGREEQAEIPRQILVRFPAFVGAWEPGQEPSFDAYYRLRVVPPRGDRKLAVRVLWVNAGDYEQLARASLLEAVMAALSGHPVYLGSPHVDRYVVPSAD